MIGLGDFGYHVFTGGKGHFDRLSLVASAEQIRETLKLDATIYYALKKKDALLLLKACLSDDR